jgi:hypothetical protein
MAGFRSARADDAHPDRRAPTWASVPR